MNKEIKYDWYEFGVFGLVRSDEIKKYIEDLKKGGYKCTAIYFNKTKEEISKILNY